MHPDLYAQVARGINQDRMRAAQLRRLARGARRATQHSNLPSVPRLVSAPGPVRSVGPSQAA